MCGIFGIINFNKKSVNRAEIEKMSNHMIFRGPDDKGIFISKNIGIGMRRLSIIDPQGQCQPISDKDNKIYLVFNGEIYNYLELRQELIKKGYDFKTNGDVEVLLHLYQEMGLNCINKINGMFSFALVDLGKKITWIARDRVGIKPLFYYEDKNKLLFSSDLLALNKIVKQNINKKSVLEYLSLSYVKDPYTMFNNIKKLKAGNQIIINNNKSNINSYWSLNLKSSFKGNLETAIKKTKELIKESVKIQLRSDVPVGILLSGGIDSATIAKFARDILGDKQIESFTVDFASKASSDTFYSKVISNEFNFKSNILKLSKENYFRIIDEIIPYLDEPLADSALIANYYLSKKAKERGIKVLLSGAGGDEIFGGYSRHFVNNLLSAQWFAHYKIPRFIIRILGKIINNDYFYRFQSDSMNYATMISGVNFYFLKKIIKKNNNFFQIVNNINLIFKDTRNKSIKTRMKVDFDNYLPSNILSLTDKATMIASVEGRVPLLDHNLVEHCYSLPEFINFYNGQQKGLFKKLLEPFFSKEFLYRRKEGFNAPINRWFLEDKNFLVSSILKQKSKYLSELIDFKKFYELTKKKKLSQSLGQSIYAIFILNKWLLRNEK